MRTRTMRIDSQGVLQVGLLAVHSKPRSLHKQTFNDIGQEAKIAFRPSLEARRGCGGSSR